MEQSITGKNAIYEALKAGQPLNLIMISRRRSWDGMIREIIAMAKKARVPVRQVDDNFFPPWARKLNHQGIIAEGAPSEYADINEIYTIAENKKLPLFLLIENVQDPHNLGALLRSAEGAGVDAVVIPKNRACPVTASVHRTSAGATEHLKIARVANINQVIDKLKDLKVWIFGLEAAGDKTYFETDLKLPMAIVIGGEDLGISQLTRKKCDFLVRIPLKGKVNSLNTSVAGALFMFEAARVR